MIHLLSYFYPRSPCGERRYWPCVHVVGRAISIHALLAESDALAPEENPTQKNFYPRSPCGERLLEQSASYNAALENFYPRSPCGERPDTSIIILDEYQFLSTLSLRRATDDLQVPASVSKISIHALLAESDRLIPSLSTMLFDFYPRSPCGERLLEQSASYNAALENFYPRSPCGERPDTSIIILDEYQFLSTLSLRRATDDLQVPASVSKISIHALLAESDRLIPSLSTMLFDFYPRSPCGERRLPTALRTPHHKFLSTLSLRRATH